MHKYATLMRCGGDACQALDGYEREAAPAEFFDKQIRRKHLIPDRVLGAGAWVSCAACTN